MCLLVVLLGLPVYALLALLVKLSSTGPVLFVQERAGLDGRTFRMLKFRTMRVRPKGDQADSWTRADEEAITGIGGFLREYGFDELPQAWNILRGDMSIIGPRPPLPSQARLFTERQRRMFEMRPGVLSLAAVRGRRSIPMERRIELHVEYVERWSLGLDAAIAWRTLWVILSKRGAIETTAEVHRETKR